MEAATAGIDMLIKSQLIGELSKHFPHLPEKDIALSVNYIIEHMSEILSQGGRIEIRGFGSFNFIFVHQDVHTTLKQAKNWLPILNMLSILNLAKSCVKR